MRIEGKYGDWYDEVRVDGEVLDPRPSLKVVNHSPDGFAWGYGGSGPAQLALAILLAAGVAQDVAVALHQTFKQRYIAGLPERGDFALDLDVVAWAEANRQELEARR